MISKERATELLAHEPEDQFQWAYANLWDACIKMDHKLMAAGLWEGTEPGPFERASELPRFTSPKDLDQESLWEFTQGFASDMRDPLTLTFRVELEQAILAAQNVVDNPMNTVPIHEKEPEEADILFDRS